MLMIKNIDSRNVHNRFQEKLKHDNTEIRNSNKVVVTADKTRNLCEMEKEDYNRFFFRVLQNHIRNRIETR